MENVENVENVEILLNTINLDEPNLDTDMQIVKKQNRRNKTARPKLEVFTYNDYINNGSILKSYTIPILKQVCKIYKLYTYGNKGVIIERITQYFKRIQNTIIIQKYTRRYFVTKILGITQEFNLKRNKCTNITDFSTLEPLNEISKEYFYCYTDIDDFTYGFDITSLITMLRTTRKLFNPYTRNPITKLHKTYIINIYNLSLIIYPSMSAVNDRFKLYITPRRPGFIHLINRLTNTFVQNNEAVISSYSNYHPILNVEQIPANYNDQYQNLINIRELPINDRICSLFIEIDQLGNYTNSSWFNTLSHIQYTHLYRSFYDIWNFRGQISYEIKNEICPMHGPFDGIFPNTVRHIDLSTTALKTACLIVFENLVYSGINNEVRKIGTLLALTALTLISQPARNVMPWLYESIIY